MQIYLYIWKKSSIFAAYFNSGIHNNQNQTRVMKAVCIFKAWGGKNMHRVFVCKNEDGGIYYVHYVGRKLAPTIAKWSRVEDAINSAKSDAFEDMCEIYANYIKL